MLFRYETMMTKKLFDFVVLEKEKIYKIGKRHIVNNDVRKKEEKIVAD